MTDTDTEPTGGVPGFRFHIVADRTGGEDTKDQDLPGAPAGTWPRAGVRLLNDPPPATVRVSTGVVDNAVAQGWATLEDSTPVVRPGGEPGNEMRRDKLHVFMHGTALVLHLMDRDDQPYDLRYRVVRNPDKYADHAEATYPDAVEAFDGDDDTPVTPEVYAAGATRVDHFYDLALEG